MFQQCVPFLQPFTVLGSDLTRPWGGFYYIDPAMTSTFILKFFRKDISKEWIPLDHLNPKLDSKIELSPKILVIAPEKRLSWQYHHRRKEIWSVLQGPVGVIRSRTDDTTPMTIHATGDVIMIDVEERHRLIGLATPAIVAELWWHLDPNHPSDEMDIVRVQDDFSR